MKISCLYWKMTRYTLSLYLTESEQEMLSRNTLQSPHQARSPPLLTNILLWIIWEFRNENWYTQYSYIQYLESTIKFYCIFFTYLFISILVHPSVHDSSACLSLTRVWCCFLRYLKPIYNEMHRYLVYNLVILDQDTIITPWNLLMFLLIPSYKCDSILIQDSIPKSYVSRVVTTDILAAKDITLVRYLWNVCWYYCYYRVKE